MKPASVTLSYVVYPPNYKPGDGYMSFGRMNNARRACVNYGPGAEVIRTVTKRNRNGGSIYTPFIKTKLGWIEDRWVYSVHTTRHEVMNPPASAAQGAEARNLNSANVMGLGEVHRASEARPADDVPAPCSPATTSGPTP